ncbi:Cell death protein 3 [Dirofilaria immitis]|nr:Cell death protein 3 [Dirofilaria immitis]
MENTAMTAERRRLLDKHLDAWTRCLQLDDVIRFLLANSIFNEHIVDIIKSEATAAMQRYQFIRQLKMRGNAAFCLFYQSLLKTNQIDLAYLIESELSNEDKNKFGRKVEYRTAHPLMKIARAVLVAVQRPQRFKRTTLREPAGILHDLIVDSVDLTADFSSFNADLMYPNFSSPRGVALIINNRYFLDMPERIGTDIDEINLNNLFRQLNYTVSEMLTAIRDFSKRPEHKLLDSSVVCVLTHGEHGELYGTDDIAISVLEFVSCLNARNCPALAYKPKLFFLQACRGQQYDRGFGTGFDGADGYFDRWFTCTTPQSQNNLPVEQKTKSPIEADILVSYATTPGYVSWRNSMKGSWFIQSICEVFAKYAKSTDILSMLTLVGW